MSTPKLRRGADLTADELDTTFQALRCICRDYEALRDAASGETRKFAERRVKMIEVLLAELVERHQVASIEAGD